MSVPALVFALASAVASGPPAPEPGSPAWCERLQELTAQAPAEPEAAARLEEALALLPPRSSAIAAQVRALAGDGDGREEARHTLALLVTDSCAPRSLTDATTSAADAAELMEADPRFGGVRKGDDLVDRILHKIWLALARLLESEGMKQYAGNARTLYFAVVLVAALMVALRLARVLRAQGEVARAKTTFDAIEGSRRREFAAWRMEADTALAAGDVRTALRAGQAALLARLGELPGSAITPAHTHREITARLDDAVAAIVVPPLRTFDTRYFGMDASVDDASRFLVEVDDAERRLAGRGSAPDGIGGSAAARIA